MRTIDEDEDMSKNKNNIVFYYSIVIGLAVISLFLPWGTFTANKGSSLLFNSSFTTTGLNGSLSLAFISIPHWLLIVLTCFSALAAIMKIKKMVDISKRVLIIINVFVLLWLAAGFYFYLNMQGVHLGLWVITIANFFSLFLLLTKFSKSKK